MRARTLITLVILFVSVFPIVSHAQTSLSGTITGNLDLTASGNPYIFSGDISIAPGATVTAEPGVIVQTFRGGITILGTLNINGTAAAPVVFTSFYDPITDIASSSGPTAPAPGDWAGMTIGAGASVHLSHAIVRYAGNCYATGCYHPENIQNAGGILSVSDSEISYSSSAGISTNSGTTTVTTTRFVHNASSAVEATGGSSTITNSFFDGNGSAGGVLAGTAFVQQGNTITDAQGVTNAFYVSGTITADQAWYSGVPYDIGNVVIAPGVTLTLSPGTVVKSHWGSLNVQGSLDAAGTVSAPVTFTSLADDTIAGDTNGDGATTTPLAGDWTGITVSPGGSASLTHTNIRYAGYCFFYSGCYISKSLNNAGGYLSMSDGEVAYSSGYGISMDSGTTTVSGVELDHNTIGYYLNGGASSFSCNDVHANSNYGMLNTTHATTTAIDNYWGDRSGPYNAKYNASGKGDEVSDYIDFSPWFTTATGTPSSTVSKVSNVMFLPGIEGSTLYDEAAGKEVWLPDSDATADDLRMNPDGTSVNPSITASGILSQTGSAQAYHAVYKDLLQEMSDWQTQYHIIATSTPYDWRLDYSTLLTNGRKLADGHISYLLPPLPGQDPYIIQTLKQLASSSPTHKVTIIAHSNGGLLAKALMQKLGATETAKLIDNVILVASPQLGTPDTIGGLLHGADLGIFLADSDKEARYLAQNMPMSYNLLPSSSYFSYADEFTHSNNQLVTTPVVTIDSASLPAWSNAYGSSITWANGLYNFMTDSAGTRSAPAVSDLADPQIVNSTLLAQAQAAHASLDAWTPPSGVHLYTIAGWGNETVSGVAYQKLPFLKCLFEASIPSLFKSGSCSRPTEVAYSPQVVVDGDGTVVTPSALWANGANDSRYWVNLETYNRPLPQTTIVSKLRTGHTEIFSIPQLRTLLTRIVTASTTTASLAYISTSTPQYSGNMDRLHFVLHSPLTLGFVDSSGNYTGATATSTESNIPGVDYQRFGEVQWLSVPKSMAGTVVMRGTGSGSFALNVEDQRGNVVVATTTFAAIPSATSTIATLAISPGIDPTASSTLQVDYNGDGIVDSDYKAQRDKLVLPDLTPPEAITGFSTTTKKIEIAGVDETSTTTIVRTATSTTITDRAGNWLTITTTQPNKHYEWFGWDDLPPFEPVSLGDDSGRSTLHSISARLGTYLPTSPTFSEFSQENRQQERPAPQETQHQDMRTFGPGTARFALYGLSYSTGTTTKTTATLHYSWNTDRSGKYTAFVSNVSTSNGHEIAVYDVRTNKTYIVSASAKDDDLDLSTRSGELLKRHHLKTYDGMCIPSVETNKGVTNIVSCSDYSLRT